MRVVRRPPSLLFILCLFICKGNNVNKIVISNVNPDEKYDYIESLLGDWKVYVNVDTNSGSNDPIPVTVIDGDYIQEDEVYIDANRLHWWWNASKDPIKLLVAILAPDLILDDLNKYLYTDGNTGWFLLSVIIRDVYNCQFNYKALEIYDEVLTSFEGHPLDKDVDTIDIYSNDTRLTLAYQLGAGIGLLEYGSGLKDAWITAKGQVFILAVRMYLSTLESV